MKMTPIVSIIMGSTSDLPVMEKAAQLLNDMHVPFEMNALSAHRTPEAVEEFTASYTIILCVHHILCVWLWFASAILIHFRPARQAVTS